MSDYKPFAVTAEEKAGWTVQAASAVSERGLALCVSAEVRKPRKGLRRSIVLRFSFDDATATATAWFNTGLVKGKLKDIQCIVERKSDFAKLYRLTTGKNLGRANEGRRLSNEMVGYNFWISVDGSVYSTDELKAENVSPEHPVFEGKDWTKTGELRQVKHHNLGRRKQRENDVNITRSSRNDNVNITRSSHAYSSEEAHSYMASPAISTTNNPLPATRLPTTSASVVEEVIPAKQQTEVEEKNEVDEFKTTMTQVNEKERAFQFHQLTGETDVDYQQRVIDESWDAMQG